MLLLLPTTTYKARDFIEAGSKRGVETVVGSDRAQALEAVAPAISVTLDFAHPEAAAEQIVRFASRHALGAIIPTDDATAEVAALAAQRLGLRHNPPEAARASRHKDRLRAILKGAGLRTPRFRLLRVEDDPALRAAEQDYPCVLKPTFLAASRGVIRADDEAQFIAAFRRIAKILQVPEVAAKGGGACELILAEEFIPGKEVAVEGLLLDGRLKILAIFDKPDPLDGPYFEETIYVTPSRHPADTLQAIASATADAAQALGLREGPLHAELRLGPQGPCLIEVAARSIGGLCARVLRFGTGLSLEELLIAHALGEKVETWERERRPAGVMMIPIPRAGTLREIRGLEAARSLPGIVEVTMSAPVGQPVVPLPEGASYLGFIFARGGSPAEVEAALRRGHAALQVLID